MTDSSPHRMEAIRVRLEPPKDGWSTFALEKEQWKCECSFSYTPSDSIADLAAAVDAVVTSIGHRVVVFHGEPEELELSLLREGPESGVLVSLSTHADRRRDKDGEDLFSFRASPLLVGTLFWRALRSLEGSMPPEEYARHWRHDFPERIVAQLGRRLKDAR